MNDPQFQGSQIYIGTNNYYVTNPGQKGMNTQIRVYRKSDGALLRTQDMAGQITDFQAGLICQGNYQGATGNISCDCFAGFDRIQMLNRFEGLNASTGHWHFVDQWGASF